MTVAPDGAPAELPSLSVVLARADGVWTRSQADEPSPPEYLDALAVAVQQQIIDRLATAAQPAGPDFGQSTRLTEDNQRLASLVAELQQQVDAFGTAETDAAAELDRLRSEASVDVELVRLRRSVVELENQVDTARAERDTAKGSVRDLTGQLRLADERAAAAMTEQAEQRRLLIEEQTALGDECLEPEPHVHLYPVDMDTGATSDCACGWVYPRALLLDEGPDEPPDLEPLDVLITRVRHELREWPEVHHA